MSSIASFASTWSRRSSRIVERVRQWKSAPIRISQLGYAAYYWCTSHCRIPENWNIPIANVGVEWKGDTVEAVGRSTEFANGGLSV